MLILVRLTVAPIGFRFGSDFGSDFGAGLRFGSSDIGNDILTVCFHSIRGRGVEGSRDGTGRDGGASLVWDLDGGGVHHDGVMLVELEVGGSGGLEDEVEG